MTGLVNFYNADQLYSCFSFLFNMAEKASGDGGAGKLTQLPVARIKTIMKSSPDLPNFSQDSVFLITKATVSVLCLTYRDSNLVLHDCVMVDSKSTVIFLMLRNAGPEQSMKSIIDGNR